MTIHQYDVPPQICRGTYVAITKLITKRYKNNIKADDDIKASIIAECINISEDAMNCDADNNFYSNVFDNHVPCTLLNCRPHHDCTFGVSFTHSTILLYSDVRNKQYYYSLVQCISEYLKNLEGKLSENATIFSCNTYRYGIHVLFTLVFTLYLKKYISVYF